MERRKAVTAAAATSLTLLVGAAGLTANAAILGRHEPGGIGQLQPVAADTSSPSTLRGSDDDLREVAPGTTAPAAPTATPSAPAGLAPVEVSDPVSAGDPAATTGAAAPAPAAISAPAAAPAPVVASAPTSAPSTAAPVTTTGASSVGSDEDEDREQEHEVEDTEHLGAEDDD